VFLRQYLLWGTDPAGRRRGAFVLATCGHVARAQFEGRTGIKTVQCVQTAESLLEKADMEGRDLWAEGRCWEVDMAEQGDIPSRRAYLDLKERAEKALKEKAAGK